MYSIGDKIVYPMHGAGVVESIEDRQILDERRRYYILRLPIGDVTVMIPCDNTDSVGVREIVDKKELKAMERALKSKSDEATGNWNRRYRDNMEKLKTGQLNSVCEVVRNLMRAEKKKKLSMGEKKMLTSAKQILISELMLVSERDAREIEEQISMLVLG
ncbi:MAG: CarD family transcriptional regulator [Clostridiales Family XIII bacterium]|nr:CarD family transcriptional regulator [Clostridiales Family XIII bacterium]